MKHLFYLLLLTLLLPVSVHVNAQTCDVHCGTERWKVKTLTDSTVDNIDADEISKTINWIRNRTRPASLPNTRRLIGIETMTFKIRGEVLVFKREADKDFHVVMAQTNNHNRTMVVEFADPQCANVCSSTFLERMRQAREDFITKFGRSSAEGLESRQSEETQGETIEGSRNLPVRP